MFWWMPSIFIVVFPFVAIPLLSQRFRIYQVFSPATCKPWTAWERFQFKWNPFFPWWELDNAYANAQYKVTLAKCQAKHLPPPHSPSLWD